VNIRAVGPSQVDPIVPYEGEHPILEVVWQSRRTRPNRRRALRGSSGGLRRSTRARSRKGGRRRTYHNLAAFLNPHVLPGLRHRCLRIHSEIGSWDLEVAQEAPNARLPEVLR
jgi:hypothetical protein